MPASINNETKEPTSIRVADILAAIAADEVIHLQEVVFVKDWMETHQLTDVRPFSLLYDYTVKALADGLIDDGEQQALLQAAKNLQAMAHDEQEVSRLSCHAAFNEAGIVIKASSIEMSDEELDNLFAEFTCKAESSNGDKHYSIVCGYVKGLAPFYATCECKGFGIHRFCYHLRDLFTGKFSKLESTSDMMTVEQFFKNVPEAVKNEAIRFVRADTERKISKGALIFLIDSKRKKRPALSSKKPLV